MGEVLTTTPAIIGVAIHPLKQIRDTRGMVMHMMRSDSPFFEGFGEIYFSVVARGIVKGWKRHKRMTQFFAVPAGELKLVVFDAREDSATVGVVQEILTGVDRYALIRIPPMVWYSFGAMGAVDAMIANCASLPHDPTESESLPLDSPSIPYRWASDGQ